MKKTLAVTMVICVLVLSACSGSGERWKPVATTEDVAPYAEQAIEIIEQYLTFDIDDKTADEKIQNLQSRIKALKINDENSKYNNADKAVAKIIDRVGLTGFKYKSDLSLRQLTDILAVQLGREPSDRAYDPKDFTYSDDNAEQAAAYKLDKTSAVNYTFLSDGSILSVDFDAMYGTKAKEVKSSIENIVSVWKENNAVSEMVIVEYSYYEQSIFSAMVTYEQGLGIFGSIYKGSVYDELASFENEDQLNAALKNAVNYAKIK